MTRINPHNAGRLIRQDEVVTYDDLLAEQDAAIERMLLEEELDEDEAQ